MPTQSMQDYLKAIYQLHDEQPGEPVTTSALAERLNITNASVTGMLKRLSTTDPQMVAYTPYNGVTLTSEGEKTALELIRHHRLIESFLSQVLGYPWDAIHDEAERLEHVLSDELEERIASALGHPTMDPHGDPIPDRDGNLPQSNSIPLSQVTDHQPAIVRRITAQEADFLRYLAEIGLVLSARVTVIAKAPFNGPLTLRIGAAELALGRDAADKILVQPVDETIMEHSHHATNATR